jgi:hypothetical protein
MTAGSRIPRLFHLCLPLAFCVVSLAATAQSASNVYTQVNRSVGIVIVSTFEGQLVGSGSAVTVASQTMVTNRHVLLPGHRYQVYVNGGIYEAYMTLCDSSQDLCLLEVRNLEAKPVEFGDANKLAVGDTVYTVGAPNEIGNIMGVSAATKQKSFSPPQLTLSNGLITALRPVEDGHIIQTNAAISPGSSGGGLFDASGRLVGITTFMMRSGQSLNMALPVNWVERLGVSGAPRTEATSSVSAASPSFQPAPAARNATVVAEHFEAENTQGPQHSNPKPPPKHSGIPLYAWLVLPLLLLLIYFMRRKRQNDEYDYDSPPAVSANTQLQTFLEQAAQELDENRAEHTLWNYIIADNKGNMAAARQSYIERRAAKLFSLEKDKQWAAAARQSQAT